MVMVDNLAEKIDNFPLNWHRYVYCLCASGSVKSVRCTDELGIHYSGFSIVLKSVEKWVGNCQLYRWCLLLMGVR